MGLKDYATETCPTCNGAGIAFNHDVGAYFKSMRKTIPIQQKQAAKIAGVAQATLNRFESGRQKLSTDAIQNLYELYTNLQEENK